MEEHRRNVIVAIATINGHNLLKTITERLKCEESSDEECDQWNYEANKFAERVCVCGNLKRVVRIEDYVLTIHNYTRKQFREHFRLTRKTYENLEQILAPKLILWLLATPDSFRSVSDRFGISKSMLHDFMRRVVASLNDLTDRFIKWPVEDRLEAVKHRFSQIGSLPDVIGAINESHIPIPAPKVHPISYRTKKKEYAITLQAVCDADLIFTDCFIGFAGSVHDARTFRNSDLWHSVSENEHYFFPNNEYIIGDKAYPVLSWCIAPYINRGNMTEAQNKFNHHHSKTRQVIERAFALLKGRFRRLKYLHMSCIDLIPYVILASCVLYNICLEGCMDDINDFICDGLEENANNNNEENIFFDRLLNDRRGLIRREYLTNLVQ
ncbi:uncharacterized protein [Cardiocondyla obscurior]|uniref:uncharacterized protein n=1 Tax=Cardiocondyla obscurior TaxID=286306 RepID=UPI0039656FBE